jgi:glutathione S-transferase
MIKFYGMTGSGNCWKPTVLMTMLGIEFENIEIDMLGGETRRAPYLALNPNGRVPLLQLSDGRLLAESNAMLCYLAEGTPYFPPSGYDSAKVLEWMFFEQYSHEPYIATVRFWIHYRGKREEWRDKIAEASAKGYAALGVMETALQKNPYLAGDTFTIADIALYAYTHVADQGDFDLAPYPAVLAWMQRCAQQPRFYSLR